jgi:membrane-bound inhibitor of C-type lysozyme
MRPKFARLVAGTGLTLLTASLAAHPADSKAGLKKLTLRYKCDSSGAKHGLNQDSFVVKYIAGDGKSVAIIPVNQHPRTFTRVMSNYGAIYLSGVLRWSVPEGSTTTFSSRSPSETFRSKCEQLNWLEPG